MGGPALIRPGAVALHLLLVVFLVGAPALALAEAGFRNHRVPALAAPFPPADADPAAPVDVDPDHCELLDGGIRLIRPEVARPGPDFEFRDRDGTLHTPESLRGRVVWLDLWATYCATCQAEFPFVQRMHERFEPRGLTILAVCRDSKSKAVARAIRKDWIGFPIVDATRHDDFPFPYHAFPTNVLLDRQGRIRGYWQGHRPPEAMEGALRRLLAEPAEGAMDRVASLGFPPLALPFLATSSSVVQARLEVPRAAVAPGDFFQAVLTLDVDPGWNLSAGADGVGDTPLALRLESGEAIAAIHHSVPGSSFLETPWGEREVHAGRVQLPVWGVLAPDAIDGEADITAVATVQACDRTRCLDPEEITVTGSLWVSREAETAP